MIEKKELLIMQNDFADAAVFVEQRLNVLRVNVDKYFAERMSSDVKSPLVQSTLDPGSSKVLPVDTKQSIDVGKFNATCSDCGCHTQVPFKPNPTWPVRCPECYKKYKNGGL